MFSVKKLRLLLAKKCLTAKDLSLRSGVSAVAIGNILNHGRKPKLATIGRLAKGLGVDVTELLTEG
ncbi:MAG: helix-turn-helix transcriptional regulator [Succiniclasticum sp.]|uniref:helix-turn-helix domain-containing protein n=1 Tax=Succiniclasticum sp. TaxID=2775030 RepID=UPI002A908D5F|nr:helix-turn-helix transcriptional regulator [Succiniclasticum sp.]MDY6290725.1 helix-turn-helix transcriptional regulator [Succiniclasticum sp.]